MTIPATTIIRRASRQYFAHAALILTILALAIMLIDIVMPRLDERILLWEAWFVFQQFTLEVAFALLIAALLISTTERRSRDELTEIFNHQRERLAGTFSGHLENIRRTIRVGIEEIGNVKSLCSFLSQVNSDSDNRSSLSHAIIRRLSDEIYQKYVRGLVATKTGFKIDDIDWSLEANELFYKALLEENIVNQEIRATHTDNLDIWLDEYEPEEALQRQQELVEKNNLKISKIFVGAEPLENSSKFRAAIEKMRKYHIEAKYVQHSTPSDVNDMTWLPDAGLVMIWRSRAENNIPEIQFIELSSDEELRRKLQSDWTFLLDRHEDNGRERSVSEIRQPMAVRLVS